MSSATPDSDLLLVQYPYATNATSARRLYVPRSDQVLVHSISGAGYWDFRVMVNLYGVAARGGSFVEVGANIGSDTVLAADFFNFCYVFEPASRHIELFQKNMELNQITHFQLFAAAVSDQCGAASLHMSDLGNTGSATLGPALAAGGAQEQVQVVTLDASLPSVTDVTFVHIDTEGHDIKVLNGAREFLARQAQKPFIKMEFQPRSLAAHGSHVNDLIQFTKDLRYNIIFNASGNYVPLSHAMLVDMFYLWQSTNGWIDIYLWP